MQVARRDVLCWDTELPSQGAPWDSFEKLDQEFFEAITAAPIRAL